jgi:uncharacterized protein
MVLATALLGVMSVEGCSRALPPRSPSAGVPEVVISSHAGTEVHVAVEVARTAKERSYGLMFRHSLAAGHGMLFLFPAPGPIKFWMHNTYIPLDMIFFTEDRRIIYIEENAEPLTDVSRGPEAWSQFVLEVPGGWARAHGIEPGATARFVDAR